MLIIWRLPDGCEKRAWQVSWDREEETGLPFYEIVQLLYSGKQRRSVHEEWIGRRRARSEINCLAGRHKESWNLRHQECPKWNEVWPGSKA